MRLSPNNTRCGFSLVEMLVATSVATLLMLIMAGVSTQVSKLLTIGVGQNQNRGNARVAMSFMAREMRQAAYSRYKSYGPARDKSILHFIINPPTSTLSTLYKNPDAVFWQAPIATNTTQGDMAEVGYFVYRQRINNIYHSDLCRFFLNPNETDYQIYTNPNQWMSTPFVGKFVPTRDNEYKGLFLENVVGLWVRPYNLNGVPKAWPDDFDSRDNDRLPPMVQVSMVIMSSNAIRRLPNNINVNVESAEICYNSITSGSNPQVIAGTETVYFNVTLDNANQ